MTFDKALAVLQVLSTVCAAAAAVYSIWRARHDKRFEDLHGRIDRLDRQANERIGRCEATRLQDLQARVRQVNSIRERTDAIAARQSVLEERVKNLPTHDDLEGLRTGLATANARLEAMDERTETTQEMVQSIHRYLLETK